jgi:predicted dehydrogenase
MTFSVEEARELVKLVESRGLVFCLTHNYTGFSLVRHARQLFTSGQMGRVRKVIVEYLSGGMADPVEKQGSPQAAWRMDPALAGAGGTLGDIGTHAFNLLEYTTGDEITRLCVDKSSFVEGRVLDDDANLLLQLRNGGKGAILVSQIATGEENALAIKIYGSKGAIRWHQEEPMKMDLFLKGQARQILTPGHPWLSEAAKEVSRTPPGLPEAYLEAFANIYRGAVQAIRFHRAGSPLKITDYSFPTVYDGLRGMLFIEKAVESAEKGSRWVEF